MNKIMMTIGSSAIALMLSHSALAGGGGGVNAAIAGVNGVQAGASNAGNSQNIVVEGSDTDIPRQAPSIVAPALTTTLSETCMGSTSIGGSGPGFGLTLGTTWRDDECVRRLNARELRAMGFGLAGKELMCDNVEVRAAFERVAKLTGNADLLCQSSADQQERTAGKIDTNRYVENVNVRAAGGERTTHVPGSAVQNNANDSVAAGSFDYPSVMDSAISP